jgi:hypothetical protein
MKRAGRKYKKMAAEVPNHDDSELDIKLRSLLEDKNDRRYDDDQEKDSMSSLIEESERIMEDLLKFAEKEIEEVEQSLVPKRLEIESKINYSLQEQLQAIEEYRHHTLNSVMQSLSGFKDIREKIQRLYDQVDSDLVSLKSISDQDLSRQLEAVRSQEAEKLRKEVRKSMNVYQK